MSAQTDVQKLILWLRKERIAWQSLTVGNIHIDGAQDIKLAGELPASKPAETRRASMFKRYGGDVIEEMTRNEGVASTVLEEDD